MVLGGRLARRKMGSRCTQLLPSPEEDEQASAPRFPRQRQFTYSADRPFRTPSTNRRKQCRFFFSFRSSRQKSRYSAGPRLRGRGERGKEVSRRLEKRREDKTHAFGLPGLDDSSSPAPLHGHPLFREEPLHRRERPRPILLVAGRPAEEHGGVRGKGSMREGGGRGEIREDRREGGARLERTGEGRGGGIERCRGRGPSGGTSERRRCKGTVPKGGGSVSEKADRC